MKTTDPLVRFDSLVETLGHMLKQCDAELAAFVVKFQKDPAYALSWGEDACSIAARRKVVLRAQQYCAVVANGEHIETLNRVNVLDVMRKEFTDAIMRAARYPARSTSVMSNVMEQCETAEQVRLLEELRYFDS